MKQQSLPALILKRITVVAKKEQESYAKVIFQFTISKHKSAIIVYLTPLLVARKVLQKSGNFS